jgi:dTDP-4-amino-4,6-dideoxygalactose transaminase
MTVPDTARHQAREVVIEHYSALGFNYRMTDLQAAIGRVQLTRLADMVTERRALARRYAESLAGVAGLQLPIEPAWARSNWQSYCVRLPRLADQRRVMQTMLDEGISTRRGVMCSHLEPAYQAEPWRCGDDSCESHTQTCGALRESEEATAHGLILPLYVGMTDDDQARVVAALAMALDNETRSQCD